MPPLQNLPPAPPRRPPKPDRSGIAQLTLVEHALCPLDDQLSLVAPLLYETGYFHCDEHGHSKFTKVSITARNGLLASDEYFLWGMLALTFAQREPSIEFSVTPHYCLRQLGCLGSLVPGTSGTLSKGGKNYMQFRSCIKRLAGVLYQCEEFYDPMRGEYRDRGFGFLKYDLPIDPESSRAWRIVWDPLFFEYCTATAGKLGFDLGTYRALDCASRRLFLFLQKIFYRNDRSPRFDVWHLAVHGLGFSPSVDIRFLKVKLAKASERLLQHGIIRLPPGVLSPKHLFEKKGTGSYAIRFQRGPYFEKDPPPLTVKTVPNFTDSPLYEPLKTIGFSDPRIRSILGSFKPRLIEVWSDITLAKLERDGQSGFTSSPAAFFIDNLKHAAEGQRTPPDWWRELRKKEERRRYEEENAQTPEPEVSAADHAGWRKARATAFKEYVNEKVGKTLYHQTVTMLVRSFDGAMPYPQALAQATQEAEHHFAGGFSFPDLETWVDQQQQRTGAPAEAR